MSEQRIDHGAAAAAGDDYDPGDGQGLATDATERSADAADVLEREEIEKGDRTDPMIAGDGSTEGERLLSATEEQP